MVQKKEETALDDFAAWVTGGTDHGQSSQEDLFEVTVQQANPHLTAEEVERLLPHQEKELRPFLSVQLQLIVLDQDQQVQLQQEQQLHFVPVYALQVEFEHQPAFDELRVDKKRKFDKRAIGMRDFLSVWSLIFRFDPSSVQYSADVSLHAGSAEAGYYQFLVPFTPRGDEDGIVAEGAIYMNNQLIKRIQASFHAQES